MATSQPPTAGNMTNGAATAHAATPGDIAKEHSLLSNMIPNLDRHLVFPLLNFLEEETPEDEPTTEITQLKYSLLKSTNMQDFVGDLYAQLHNLSERPSEYADKREQVLSEREKYEEETGKLQDLLADTEVVGNLRSDKEGNMAYLQSNH
ncbi:hypothetical protein KC352_g43542, partial [Hortaea werneckii]